MLPVCPASCRSTDSMRLMEQVGEKPRRRETSRASRHSRNVCHYFLNQICSCSSSNLHGGSSLLCLLLVWPAPVKTCVSAIISALFSNGGMVKIAVVCIHRAAYELLSPRQCRAQSSLRESSRLFKVSFHKKKIDGITAKQPHFGDKPKRGLVETHLKLQCSG